MEIVLETHSVTLDLPRCWQGRTSNVERNFKVLQGIVINLNVAIHLQNTKQSQWFIVSKSCKGCLFRCHQSRSLLVMWGKLIHCHVVCCKCHVLSVRNYPHRFVLRNFLFVVFVEVYSLLFSFLVCFYQYDFVLKTMCLIYFMVFLI